MGGRFISVGVAVGVAFLAAAAARGDEAVSPADPRPVERTLFNGIELPAEWPPRSEALSDEPRRPPYLAAPPEVVPIDVGRQLFVDDFLISATTLERTFHRPEYFAGNPVLEPDRPWESRLEGGAEKSDGPFTAPFSDGVWYDPQDRIFKMWYAASYKGGMTCYATSRDGIHWEKPALGVAPADRDSTPEASPSNIVLVRSRDSSTVWLDPQPNDPGERFKLAMTDKDGTPFTLFRSPDGIHWTKVADGPKIGDRSTFFYNPFRRRWVFSLRGYAPDLGRCRRYWETDDFFAFKADASPRVRPVLWTAADRDDRQRDDLQAKPELYNLDCVAYESLIVGLFTILQGDYSKAKTLPTEAAWQLRDAGRPKQNVVCAGFSRDGFHWDRPDRRPFMPVSEQAGDWNWGNVQSTAPGFLIVDDQLWFYVSGRAGRSHPGCGSHDAGATTGLAKLRRDGFASMDAADRAGELTTRPVRFRGRHLFVNLDAPEGELRVEVLDRDGRPIPGLDLARCRPLTGDSTRSAVTWDGAADLAQVAGQPVRFRFRLTRGRLYSFWVTTDPAGASFGHLAGGGPAFGGFTDVPPAEDAGGWQSLFDGQSLAGWHASAKSDHSAASRNTSAGRWVVDDGAIIGSQDIPGNGGIILTDREFGDFEVVVEMNNDFGPDSGLFLRSTEDGKAYQAMIDYHAGGNLMGIYGEGLGGRPLVCNFVFGDAVTKIDLRAIGDPVVPFPILPEAWPAFWRHGEWNELRARIVGGAEPTITTWINGVKISEWTETEPRHPPRGRIALQVHGGGSAAGYAGKFVRYRGIKVREIPAAK